MLPCLLPCRMCRHADRRAPLPVPPGGMRRSDYDLSTASHVVFKSNQCEGWSAFCMLLRRFSRGYPVSMPCCRQHRSRFRNALEMVNASLCVFLNEARMTSHFPLFDDTLCLSFFVSNLSDRFFFFFKISLQVFHFHKQPLLITRVPPNISLIAFEVCSFDPRAPYLYCRQGSSLIV